MRPRLNARLWNEIALVTSQLELEADRQRHHAAPAASSTASVTATDHNHNHNHNHVAATQDTPPNLAVNGLTVSPPPSSSPTKGASLKSLSGSVLGPWDNVSALIAQAAHTPAAQPDRLMHDVAITSLRSAAAYALSTLASSFSPSAQQHHHHHEQDIDACWAPLLRILDSAWTQLTTLTTHLAHSTTDLLTLTNTDLPALIGLTRALDDAFIPLPATAFADQVRWLSEVSGPTAALRLQGIAATLARIEVDSGATGARLRKRLAGYWTRTPFCAESIHSGAMGLVRNALALAVWDACLVPDEHAAMGANGAGGMMMAHPMPVGAPVTREAAARLRALSTDGMQHHHRHTRRHALPPPRSFRVAWDRICSAKALVDLGATGIPADVLEDITTLCLHHFHPLYAAQDGRVPPDALASDLYTCTLAWILCEKLPLEGMVPILFAVFRPASPASAGSSMHEGGVSFSNKPSASPTSPQQRANSGPQGHSTFSVPVLTAAADCLSILTLALASRAGSTAHAAIAQIQSFLIDILTTPHPAFAAAHTPDILSSFRASLTRALAHTARNLPSDRTTTLLYSLIRNASGDIAQAKLDNCTMGVAAVVAAVRRTDAFDTAVPFLTRLLVMGDQKPSEGTDSTSLDTRGCLDLLARVAKSAPLEVFAEVGRFVATYARSHVSDDVATKIVMSTVASLSKDADPDQKRVVLVTLLRYFCEKATWAVETFGNDKDKIRASVAHLVGLLASVCRSVYVGEPAGAAEVDAKPIVPVQQQPLLQQSSVALLNGQGGWTCPSDAVLMNHVRAAWHAIIVLDLAKSESAVDSTADLASATPMPTFSPVVAPPMLAAFSASSGGSPTVRLATLVGAPQALTYYLTPEHALHMITGYHILCCRAADMRVDPVAVYLRAVDEEGPKPTGQVFAVWQAVLDTVMDRFYFTSAARSKPVRSRARLVELAVALLRGSTHKHAQVAAGCQGMLRKLVSAYPPVLLAQGVAETLADGPSGSAAQELLKSQLREVTRSTGSSAAGGGGGEKLPLVTAVLADAVVKCPKRSLAAVLGQLPHEWVDAFTWHLAHWAGAWHVARGLGKSGRRELKARCRAAVRMHSTTITIKEDAAAAVAAGKGDDGEHAGMITELLFEAAAVLCVVPPSRPGMAVSAAASAVHDMSLLRSVVHLPLNVFSVESVRAGVAVWHTILHHHPDLEPSLLLVLERCWHLDLVDKHRGLFATKSPVHNPLADKIHYTGEKFDVSESPEERQFAAALGVIDFLADRIATNLTTVSPSLIRLLLASTHHDQLTRHPESRCARFALCTAALNAAMHPACPQDARDLLRAQVLDCALQWFALPPAWARDAQVAVTRVKRFLGAARAAYRAQSQLNAAAAAAAGTAPSSSSANPPAPSASGSGGPVTGSSSSSTSTEYKLLELLLADEIETMLTWGTPGNPPATPDDVGAVLAAAAGFGAGTWRTYARVAWKINPAIAFHLSARFRSPPPLEAELEILTLARAASPILHKCTPAVPYLLTQSNLVNDVPALRYLSYWDPVPPVKAITLFQPSYHYHPLVLQYALRSLFAYPIEAVFFFVPQIVQALRHDPLGYVQEFILRAAQTSPVFAHQIIWNMKANMYRDEAGNEPDSLQPLFDEIIDKIIKSFSSADESFYQREFEFFNKITSISGKLKPYIKRSKPEKKKKIDEELAQIKVDVGCYLPSNPESTVIDIDYLSGRPLQSHAKAPFLATFKIERTTLVPPFRKEQVWQSAIFKVGDDCRQDVLALQLIALFKSVFASAHLDLYLFPYRVVATAPGCGVIEVIPNSTSRDMIGREKINSMFEYFVAKFGSPHTDAYRRAQRNFITSVAGYSVILFLLQIKDRHNGNIMLDSDGHLIHIDFGFILDISPGGINFESSPFKLTTEMLQVIGPVGSEAFRDFARCVVQAFLAIRPYADAIINLVQLMSESGLPCFKGEPTLRKLRGRFVLEKSEREAARFMMDRIAESYENKRTVLYDQFQKQTNGIPY